MNLRFPIGAIFCLGVLSAQSPSFDLTTVPTKSTPQSLVVGDFNRDGKADLAVSGINAAGNGTVEILLGNGDGTFRATGVIAIGAYASRIAKADFNNDGKLDLAVSVGDTGQVVVLLGKGDGTFQAPVDSGAKTPAGQVVAGIPGLAVGDINGDGKPDLVLGPYTFTSSCSVAVMLGNGDGTFQSPINSAMDRVDRPKALVADLNGDGRADVFATGWSDSFGQRFGWLLGNADGSLTLNWSMYTYPFIFGTWITIQDVNGNGKPDVIAVDIVDYPNAGRFPITAFLDGSLNTTLFSSVDIPLDTNYYGWGFQSLAAADVNGDGHPDLLLSDIYGSLIVMLGQGDGTFHGPPAYPVPSSSVTIYTGATSSPGQTYADIYGSLTTSDFRGVGRQDAVMALAGKSVSLMKNAAGTGPVVPPAGLTNAASLATEPGVPGSLMAVFGGGFAYGSGTLQNGYSNPRALPNTLFGLTMQTNGIDAPLLYASPTQANIQIPWELAGKTQATLLATRNGSTTTITIPIAAYAPGLFTMTEEGTGQAAAIINASTPPTIPAPVGAFPGSRPVHRGEYLSLYGTGFGALKINPPATGLMTASFCCSFTTATPLVTVGGVSATVQFSGLAPGMVGVYQINILIPDNAPTGSAVPVMLSIARVAANSVTIAIQ